ncbi:universal stress protein [soil metagenome]
MFKTILVPTDGSPLSDKAINAAIEFAKLSGSKIIGLSVAEPYLYTPLSEGPMAVDADSYREKMLSMAQLHAQKIAEAAKEGGVAYETMVKESFSPYQEIINVAEEKKCGIIFMASHGRKGLSKLFLGSETQKVLAHSSIPVLVFR